MEIYRQIAGVKVSLSAGRAKKQGSTFVSSTSSTTTEARYIP